MPEYTLNASRLLRLWSVAVVLCVAATLAAGSAPVFAADTPTGGHIYRLYLPLNIKPEPRTFQWQRTGFSGNVRYAGPVVKGYDNFWFWDWTASCDDVLDPFDPENGTTLQRHIPIVRPWSMHTFTNTLVSSACNDGRPVFIMNEPDKADQDNLNYQQVIDFIETATHAGWRGPIYVGGFLVNHEEWIEGFFAAWADAHGGSRVIPGIAGWELHAYLNIIPSVYDVSQETIDHGIDVNLDQLQRFIDHRRAEGNPTDTVITEFGWLGRTDEHGRHDAVMIHILDRYVRGFAARPEVKAWAWYTAWAPPEQMVDSYDMANLVEKVDGTYRPTAIGERWRQYMLAASYDRNRLPD